MNAFIHPVVLAVGWTLLHSLWQGAVVAAILAAILHLFRGSTARFRHILACLGMVACLALPMATLLHLWPDSPAPVAQAIANPANLTASPLPGLTEAGSALLFSAKVERFLLPVLPWIVATWCLGAWVGLIRLTGGWFWLHRHRRAQTLPAPGEWIRRLARLAPGLGLSRCPELRLSACVPGPIVHGWWRPAILLPASLLAGMDPFLVEALLAHELAHVRRQDYLVNILQSLSETLLFYHPAVWWISAKIRATREEACDDLAALAIGEPRRLALALAELDLFQLPAPALGAHQGNLMTRIKRLLYPARPEPISGALMPTLIGLFLLSPMLAHSRPSPHSGPLQSVAIASNRSDAAGPLNRSTTRSEDQPEITQRAFLKRRGDALTVDLLVTRAELANLVRANWNWLFSKEGENQEVKQSFPPVPKNPAEIISAEWKEISPEKFLEWLATQGVTPPVGSPAWLQQLPPAEAEGELARNADGSWALHLNTSILRGVEIKISNAQSQKLLGKIQIGTPSPADSFLRERANPTIKFEDNDTTQGFRIDIHEVESGQRGGIVIPADPNKVKFHFRLDGTTSSSSGPQASSGIRAETLPAPSGSVGLTPSPEILPASQAIQPGLERPVAPKPPSPDPVPLAKPQSWKVQQSVPVTYPDKALRSGLRGEVILQIKVDDQGKPLEVKAIRGNEILSDACLQAVRQWLFESPTAYGLKAPVSFQMGFRFDPPDGPAATEPPKESANWSNQFQRRYASIDFIINANAMRGRSR